MSAQDGLTKLAGVIYLLSLQQCGELAAFAVLPPPGIHQLITEEALTENNFHFNLPNGEQVKFSESAIDPIELDNKFIDDWSKDTPYFDDERFSEGQRHLLETRDLIILQLKDEAFSKSDLVSLERQKSLTARSRALLGNALHPLQDYYSHTNWVERKLNVGYTVENIPINTALGAKGEMLPGGKDEACNESDPGATPLTSGDYLTTGGIRNCDNICDAKPFKCAHGNVFADYVEARAICRFGEIPPNLNCGINKDRDFRTNHAEAYNVAKKHTAIFVTEIFKEALKDSGANESFVALAICQFMGVPNPETTCTTSHTVTVQKLIRADGSPTLEGLVQSSGSSISPAIDCGLLCQGTAIAGSTIVLAAKDSGDWIFVRWEEGGACADSTSRECTVNMNSDQSAGAVFAETDPTPVVLQNYYFSCWVSLSGPLYCDHTPDPGAARFFTRKSATFMAIHTPPGSPISL